MKKLALLLCLISSLTTLAALEDGKYVGINEETGGTCSLRIEYDGDYAFSGQVEYRLTILSRGAFIDCKDYDDVQYDNCGGGSQTNGNQDKDLYLLGISNNKIEKVYFQSNDYNDKEKVCLNLTKID